jgi:Putative prokaryotic signal transducing protein
MKRVCRAPNIAIAQIWVDMLRERGIQASVQRYFASSIAGDIPPDQAWPEIWIEDETQLAAATHIIEAPQQRRWVCADCGELVEGGFEVCWNCGLAASTVA